MWEHEFLDTSKEDLKAWLKAYEDNGYELVTATFRYRNGMFDDPVFSLFFKRPKQKSTEEENKARSILGLPPL